MDIISYLTNIIYLHKLKSSHTIQCIGWQVVASKICHRQFLKPLNMPKYLRVTLEIKLAMHQDIKQKASEKLALLRKLASIKWDAKAEMLCALYLRAVR